VGLNKLVILSKDTQSVVIFLLGAIGSMVLADEVDEFSLGLGDGSLSEEGA